MAEDLDDYIEHLNPSSISVNLYFHTESLTLDSLSPNRIRVVPQVELSHHPSRNPRQ